VTKDLFEEEAATGLDQERLGPGAVVLRSFAVTKTAPLLAAIERVSAKAPFRHMTTPVGFRMSVAMTNCGTLGWVTDRTGYRYQAVDPISGHRWPRMPSVFLHLARNAASRAGFDDFVPDACLINQYEPGAKLSLHQDKDEQYFDAPIVSVSLGVPAVFLFGGVHRADRSARVSLCHGDVVVWGGPDRLRYHGVLPLKKGFHAALGTRRINLTLRKAA